MYRFSYDIGFFVVHINGVHDVYDLSGYQLEDENNFENKELVSPKQTNFPTVGSRFSYEFPKQSVTIFRIK